MENITFNNVLEFWFGEFDENGEVSPATKKKWWNKDPKFDAQIALKFTQVVHDADRGKFDHWEESAKGRLGLIILLDQFPRHIWRDKAQSFAYVDRVLKICQAGIAADQDKELNLIERQFFYLPLMHSESLAVQEQSLIKYQELVDDAPPHRKMDFKEVWGFAKRHYDIIARFGRYPHRNKILGRDSTKEELEFLKQPGSSF